MPGLNQNRLTWFFVFLPTLLQLCVALTFDFGADEAHYMLYAMHLDWSYFDHPPLVGWMHFLFNSVLGENLFSGRLPAIILGAYSSFEMFRFLQAQGFSQKSSQWAVLAMGFCFQFFVLHLFLLPDTLCLALFWPLMRSAMAVSERPTVQSWLSLGFFLGLMGLAKYTGVFFVVPIAGVLLVQYRLRFLKQPGFYLAFALSSFLISPVVYWNAKHDWLSFKYQGAHVLGGTSGLESFAKSVAAQFALYSPFLWAFAFVGLFVMAKKILKMGQGHRSKIEVACSSHFNLSLLFVFLTAGTFGLFFFVSSWKAIVLPHWPAFFYFLFLPWGIAGVFSIRPKTVQAVVGATATIIFILVILLVSGLGFRIPDGLKEVGGWPQFMPQVLSRLKSENEGVAFLNWTYGSRALYYAGLKDEGRVFVLDQRFDQFDLWNPLSPTGRDLWIVQFSYDEKDFSREVRCQSLGKKEKIPVIKRGTLLYEVILQKCEGAQIISSAGS